MNTNPSILSSLIVSFFYLALFFLVFGQKRSSHTKSSFLALSGAHFTITFLEFLARLNFSFNIVKCISHLMLGVFLLSGAAMVYFGYSITNRKFDNVFKSILAIQFISLIYVFFPNALKFEFNDLSGYYYAIPAELTSMVLGLVVIAPAIYMAFLIVKKYFITKNDKEKNILRIMLTGLIFSLIWGSLILVVIPLLFYDFNFLHRYSALSTLIFLFSSYYAINKYLFLTINYDEIETVSKNLFLNLKEGVVVVGKFGGVVQSNSAAKEILGEEININVLTTKISDYHIDKTYLNYETTINLKDKQKFVKLTQTNIENSDHSQSFGKLLILSEITNEVLMEREREQLEEQVRHADKMRAIGQLAGGVAHDFNNQLAGIVGCAEIIHDEVHDNEFLHEITHDITEAAKRAGSLTDQLLAFARKGKYLSREIDLHNIINDTITLLKRSIDKKITLKKDFLAKNSKVMGDPYQLHNAFLNIALNARDAMNGNSGEILFKTYNDDDINAIVVEINDNGHGINKDIQEKIFEPFFTTKSVGQGTGMGLAAVYGIIDNHNGNVTFESNEGEGTTFKIILQYVNNNSSEESNNKSIKLHESHKHNYKGLKKKKIIIIDDEEIVCKSTTLVLKTEGHSVNGFTKPDKALDFLKKNKGMLDIAILDLMMPEIDGYQMFEIIKEIDPHIKILIASGYSLDKKTQSLLDKGAKSFIQKPFTKEEIIDQINNLTI